MARVKTYNHYDEDHEMDGPHRLTVGRIARVIDGDAVGVYLLASDCDDCDEPELLVCYVGRGNLKQRLSWWASTSDYSHFYFQELDDDHEAFRSECALFHDYGKIRHLDNEIHPARPRGSRLPVCSVLGCSGEDD